MARAVLAEADPASLDERWRALGLDPEFTMLRGPETGLVAIRGRMGGGGGPFALGEATVTRASVRLATGAVGHAIMLGRDTKKATLVAVIDALALDPETSARIDSEIIEPLRADIANGDAERAAHAAATRVDFFTLVRGED